MEINLFNWSERWPGNTRTTRDQGKTYSERFRLSPTLVLEPLGVLAVLVILSDLAQFSHRFRSQRLGVVPYGTPSLRRNISAVPWGSPFELVRVYLLRYSRPSSSAFFCLVGVERINARLGSICFAKRLVPFPVLQDRQL